MGLIRCKDNGVEGCVLGKLSLGKYMSISLSTMLLPADDTHLLFNPEVTRVHFTINSIEALAVIYKFILMVSMLKILSCRVKHVTTKAGITKQELCAFKDILVIKFLGLIWCIRECD